VREEYKQPGFNYGGTSLVEQRAPDIEGEGGSVWRLNIVSPEARQRPEQHALVGLWLLHAPHAHILWEYYVVHLIHLRDIEGVQSAHRNTPKMEYQVDVFTLNPEAPLPLMLELEQGALSERKLSILHPADFEAQFEPVGGDHIAYDIVDELCGFVAKGKLSPDSDYRSQWALHLAGRAMHEIGENKGRGVH
jgi:hypothetical protein